MASLMSDAKAAAPPQSPDKSADPDKSLATVAGAAGAVGIAAGFILRSIAGKAEQELTDLVARMSKERTREAVQSLSAQKQSLDFRSGVEYSVGTGLIALGAATLVAAGLVYFLGVKPRRAAALLFPPFLFVAVYATYMVGVESLAFTGFSAIALLAYVTSGPSDRARKELEAFRNFPARAEVSNDDAHPYRASYLAVEKSKIVKLLRTVTSLPPELERLLPLVGEGRPVVYYQLKKNLAYVAVVEADAYNVSDFFTILMALDEQAPRFVARPLPIVEGRRVKNTGVKFPDDPDFTEEYLVEPSHGAAGPEVDRIREFLSDEARDALYDLPRTWLLVERSAMAVTVYGAFDADIADRLVELADVLFAEHGAEGGPTLFEPDGAIDPSGRGKTKKKKGKHKAEGPPASPPAS
jgi:hypothetical protein